MLENAEKVFEPVPKRVVYLYSSWQDGYSKIKAQLSESMNIEFIQASTFTEEQLQEWGGATDEDQCIVAIDDNTMTTSSSKELAHLFTVARHYQISIVCFWHLIFANTQPSKIMSQNAGYYILMNSPKMQHQIGILGTQLGIHKRLQCAYNKEMEKPYGYILVDMVTNRNDMRVRTNITDDHQIVYL